MAYPTYPNTIDNATSGDGPEIQANFAAFLAGITDGTKDININGLTANGDTTVSSDIVPSGNGTKDIGNSLFGTKDVYIKGTRTGERVIYVAGYNGVTLSSADMTTPAFLNVGVFDAQGSTRGGWFPRGFVMDRPGSIVGISCNYAVMTYSAPSASFNCHVYNSSLVSLFSTGAVSITSTGNFQAYATQARGIDTFAAGDLLIVGIQNGGSAGGGGNAVASIYFEVILDT